MEVAHDVATDKTAATNVCPQDNSRVGDQALNSPPQRHAVSPRTLLAIGAMAFAYATNLGAFLLIAPIITVINKDLGPVSYYTWLASAWSITGGPGLVVAGTLSDLIGRRWFIIGSGIVSGVSGIVGATAHSVPQGKSLSRPSFGQAGALTSFASIGELVPNKWRGYVLGVVNLSAGVFVLCGSLFGNEMAASTGPGWRSAFYFTLATQFAAAFVCLLTYFPATPLATRNITKKQIIREFDYLGLLGIFLGPVLLLLGITWIPEYGANSAKFIAPFVTGTILMIALGFWEARGASNPLLHPFLFSRVRTFTMLLVVAFVGGMLFYALQSFWPPFLAAVFDGTDARQIGIDGIPFGAGTQVGGVGSALLLPILGPKVGTHSMLTFGVALQLLFIPLMYLVTPFRKDIALCFTFFGGVGIGVAELLTILLVQLSTPDEWIGFATGALGLARMLGGTAGTAIYTSIYQDKVTKIVPSRVAAVVLPMGLPESSLPQLLGVLLGTTPDMPISKVEGITPDMIGPAVLASREGQVASFRYVWLASIAFGVVSLICAAITKDLSPRLTMDVAQHLKGDIIPDAEKNSVSMEHIEHGSQAVAGS
ncbi:hypothetical protein FNAPI_5861 [Fusarium napiforme]|uniref:Major facilitator superfamily (MFS) profile domain-containing protein n=1 Tax=Fusarium napiforme TaxID=42672 RepID=A0A8H5JL85_9HYPO|nr:hypothetical protein FNAPI_5861 [Fusarium napiforme]